MTPKTIIVPLDGYEFSERAIGPAAALARESGAGLVLMTSRLGGVPQPDQALQAAAARTGVTPDRMVVNRDELAASAIIAQSQDEPDALVCMTTHARTGRVEAIFGGVTTEVVRKSRVPLVLVGPSVKATGESRFEELIVCFDGSHAADEIVPVAINFARDHNLAVWLVTVVEGRAQGGVEAMPQQRIARGFEAAGIDVNWETLHGKHAAEKIVEFAGSRPSALLAMTTHGRTGMKRISAGSVTMSVVHNAPCPALVTRCALSE